MSPTSPAHAWRSWCVVDAVLDPDKLFGKSAYLLRVMLHDTTYDWDDENENDARRWRMLILEDCDELMRNDAKSGSGQSLARLLNVTDGLLGQARDLLVCITTNENITALHPAVTRPGRCLSQLHVGRLSFAEATEWIGDDRSVPSHGATLAELYALRGDIGKVEHTEPTPPMGFYL
jgi:hypothetical protein